VPQKLNVEITGATGEKTIKQVMVIRSWQDASGAQVMLFENGSYGYRNGEPIRSEAEFDIMTSAVQRKAAIAWWTRAGQEISESYYAAKQRREEEMQGDFQAFTGSDSDLDSILYTRAPSGNQQETSGPFSWMDLFPKRPDWWGQAISIRFGDFVYAQAETSMQGPPATEKAVGERVDEVEEGSGFRFQGSGKSRNKKTFSD
jgi:hypothetical protein